MSAPTWHVIQAPCHTCDSGALVAVHPAQAKRARCGPCLAAGRPVTGELVEVERHAVPGAGEEDWGTLFRRWLGKDQEPEEELVTPEPERTSADGWPEGFAVPPGAASLIKAAEAVGWVTEHRYARGSVVCRRKVGEGFARLVERRHSVAVRLWHPARGLHAVAVWEAATEAKKLSWKADLAKVWRSGEIPREVGVTALTTVWREVVPMELMVSDGGFVDFGRKYAIRVSLGAEDVERGWVALAKLADLLERGARELGWPELGRWELKAADYQPPVDAWRVTFRVWPPLPDPDVW